MGYRGEKKKKLKLTETYFFPLVRRENKKNRSLSVHGGTGPYHCTSERAERRRRRRQRTRYVVRGRQFRRWPTTDDGSHFFRPGRSTNRRSRTHAPTNARARPARTHAVPHPSLLLAPTNAANTADHDQQPDGSGGLRARHRPLSTAVAVLSVYTSVPHHTIYTTPHDYHRDTTTATIVVHRRLSTTTH